METNKYASFTDEQMLEKQRKNKMTFNLFLALVILSFLMICLSFGYYVGADAATDGKGKFHGKPFFIPLVLILILYFSGTKDRKAFGEEMKRRSL